MKFIDKFPDMKYIDHECGGIIRGRNQTACIVCGWPTEFIEINYEAHLCSEECVAEMDLHANAAFERYIKTDDEDLLYNDGLVVETDERSNHAKENCEKTQEGCAETRSCPFE